ncbi:MAG: hypothetical protein IJ733_18910 [Lachnospiraceae bacterium]|nr:hypothetical protein [Lachnospiraceae bacterium]
MCKGKRRKNKIETANIGVVKNANIGTHVSVDVTKIVKYITIAGVLIVAIIFGTGTYKIVTENSNQVKED